MFICYCISSVQSLSHVWLFETPWTVAPRPPCPSLTPRVYSDSCPLNQWCHPTISSSVVTFSSSLRSYPASGSFPMSQSFASEGICYCIWISKSPLCYGHLNKAPMNTYLHIFRYTDVLFLYDTFLKVGLMGWRSIVLMDFNSYYRITSQNDCNSVR